MQTLIQFGKQNGFNSTLVSKSEKEDGIGAVIGLNFVKAGIWYTPAEMVKTAGFEMKHSCGKIKARNAAEAEKQIIDQMKASKVIAAEIVACNEYKRGEFGVNVRYIK